MYVCNCLVKPRFVAVHSPGVFGPEALVDLCEGHRQRRGWQLRNRPGQRASGSDDLPGDVYFNRKTIGKP